VMMAYDCYVAICKSLHYLTIMNRWVCILLLVVSWAGGFAHSIMQIISCVVSLSVGPISLITSSVTCTHC
jgi:olfactory receptor